jgi:hypothetical protein
MCDICSRSCAEYPTLNGCVPSHLLYNTSPSLHQQNQQQHEQGAQQAQQAAYSASTGTNGTNYTPSGPQSLYNGSGSLQDGSPRSAALPDHITERTVTQHGKLRTVAIRGRADAAPQ